MTRLLTLCSLPRTDPGNRLQYVRQNGPYKLGMIAGTDNKLPFGNLPRLLLAWVCTEALQTQKRDLILGPSLLAFMRQLGMTSNSGGDRGDQPASKTKWTGFLMPMCRLGMNSQGTRPRTFSAVADKTELWWDYRKPEQDTLWQSRIHLGKGFFERNYRPSGAARYAYSQDIAAFILGLDLYMWLSYKTHRLYTQKQKPERLTWPRLYLQISTRPGTGAQS